MVVDPTTAYHEGLFAAIPFVQEGYVLHYITTPSFYLELAILAYTAWILSPRLYSLSLSFVERRTQHQ